MAKKKLIRLTESDLHRIVEESTKDIIKEWGMETGNLNQDTLQKSIDKVRRVYDKAMQSLTELFQACEEIPNEHVKMYFRPHVTTALNRLKGMFQ